MLELENICKNLSVPTVTEGLARKFRQIVPRGTGACKSPEKAFLAKPSIPRGGWISNMLTLSMCVVFEQVKDGVLVVSRGLPKGEIRKPPLGSFWFFWRSKRTYYSMKRFRILKYKKRTLLFTQAIPPSFCFAKIHLPRGLGGFFLGCVRRSLSRLF